MGVSKGSFPGPRKELELLGRILRRVCLIILFSVKKEGGFFLRIGLMSPTRKEKSVFLVVLSIVILFDTL